MGRIFETQFRKGSYIDSHGKVVGNNTNGVFKRDNHGLGWYTDVTGKLYYQTPFVGQQDWSISISVKPEAIVDSTAWDAFFAFTGDGNTYQTGFAVTTGRIIGEDSDSALFSQNFVNPPAFGVWSHIIITYTASTKVINMYVNGVFDATTTVVANIRTSTRFIFGYMQGREYMGLIGDAVVYDHVFTVNERAKSYSEFIQAQPLGANKYPRYNPHSKPISLGNEVGLVSAYNMIPKDGSLIDISGNGNDGVITGAISSIDGLVFNGVDNEINFSNINLGKTYTLCFRIKPKDLALSFLLNGSGNDDYIAFINATTINHRVNNGGSASFTVPTILTDQTYNLIFTRDGTTTVKCYINGVQEGGDKTIDSNDDFEIDGISNHSASFYNGLYKDFKVYNYAFTEQQAIDYHNSFARRVKLIEDFSLDAVGSVVPKGWTQGTGVYEIKELAAQDSVLKHLGIGTKYLENTSVGTIAIPSKSAYGTWEFDFNKGGSGSVSFVHICNTKSDGTGDGYAFRTTQTEEVQLYIVTAGALGNLFWTAASYISMDTWYRFRITRTKDGELSVYIKGGAFGESDYTLVTVAGGANPRTDNTHTTSEYFVSEFTTDTEDRIANIEITEGVVQ